MWYYVFLIFYLFKKKKGNFHPEMDILNFSDGSQIWVIAWRYLLASTLVDYLLFPLM